jgi:uncharacterized protein YxjI
MLVARRLAGACLPRRHIAHHGRSEQATPRFCVNAHRDAGHEGAVRRRLKLRVDKNGPVSTTASSPAGVLDAIEGSNRFLIQQVFRPIGNEYRISIPSPGSTEEGEPLLFVKQKKLAIKEDIRFRLSPDDEAHLFMIKAKTVFEFRGRHEVFDANGQVIGLLEKDFARSLLRSHWHVRDPAGTDLLEAHEASWVVALVRRFADLGPDWLAALTWLPFNFKLVRGGNQVGSYRRVLGKLRDRYVLELDSGLDGVDRRLVLAFAVGLDALQDR